MNWTSFRSDFNVSWKKSKQNIQNSTINSLFDTLSKWHDPHISQKLWFSLKQNIFKSKLAYPLQFLFLPIVSERIHSFVLCFDSCPLSKCFPLAHLHSHNYRNRFTSFFLFRIKIKFECFNGHSHATSYLLQ